MSPAPADLVNALELGARAASIERDLALAQLPRLTDAGAQEGTRVRGELRFGVFEGAGYSPRGLYRSEIHIGMLHRGSYGPVSEEALARAIEHLSGGER